MRYQPALFLVILAAGTTQAAEVRVDKFSSNEDCGTSPSFDVVETSPLDPKTNEKGESLRVFFNDFFLQTSSKGTTKKNCVLDAKIRIPSGYKFQPVSAAAEGSYNLQPEGQSKGFISISYEVQPNKWMAQQNNEAAPFTGQGDINVIAKLDEEFIRSCSRRDDVVTLHTNIDLRIQQKTNSFSQMDIDSARQNHDLSWKWKLYSCSAYFEDKEFQTTRNIPYEDSLPATVLFNGSRGTFVSGGYAGNFSEVVYKDRGRKVQGKWSYGGNRGSFKFKLVDEKTGEFEGTWKDAKDSDQQGSWNGRYSEAY